MGPETQDYIKVGLEEGNSKWEAEEGKTKNVRVEQWEKTPTHTTKRRKAMVNNSCFILELFAEVYLKGCVNHLTISHQQTSH